MGRIQCFRNEPRYRRRGLRGENEQCCKISLLGNTTCGLSLRVIVELFQNVGSFADDFSIEQAGFG
jgi:hypothetical protein